MPDTIISTCCARCDPNQYTRTRLAMTDPKIAPTVLAAYTPPTSRPGSSPRLATAASASGKLAPHRIGPGSTAQNARTKSSWKLYQMLVVIDVLMGQYGSDSISM